MSNDGQVAIAHLWEEYGAAMARLDAAAAAALYARDADVIEIDGTLLNGPAEIEAYYARQLSGAYAKLSLSDVEFAAPRLLAQDVALVNGKWLVHGLGPQPIPVRSTLIVRRDPNGWRYAAARFMAALQVSH